MLLSQLTPPSLHHPHILKPVLYVCVSISALQGSFVTPCAPLFPYVPLSENLDTLAVKALLKQTFFMESVLRAQTRISCCDAGGVQIQKFCPYVWNVGSFKMSDVVSSTGVPWWSHPHAPHSASPLSRNVQAARH